jgi:hypothetical protein
MAKRGHELAKHGGLQALGASELMKKQAGQRIHADLQSSPPATHGTGWQNRPGAHSINLLLRHSALTTEPIVFLQEATLLN